MRRSLGSLGSLGLAAALLASAQERVPFEGALVLELPGEGGPAAGDVLLSLDGRAPATLPALRRQIGESLGASVKARVRREGRDLELAWTPSPGTYRLTDWPSPAELFRRAHAKDLEGAAAQAGLQGLQAAAEGKARTALRQLQRAAEAGMKDPLLDWAEAWVLIRHQGLAADAEGPLGRAMKSSDRRLRGLCHVAAATTNLMHARRPEDALREYAAARALGADTAELARALAAALPPDSRQGWDFRVQAFEDDPLDRPLAEFLAARAPNDAASARYSAWALRLSGAAGSDPRVELTGLMTRLDLDPDARPALEALLARAEKLAPEDRARALEALAAQGERAGQGERAFELRQEALRTAPSAARARSLARAARRAGRTAPALRQIRDLLTPKADAMNDRWMGEYLSIYQALLRDAEAAVGAKILEEAVRLSRQGRVAEAVEFLEDRAGAEALPELRVTAGLLLRESGETPDPDRYFAIDAAFWQRMGTVAWAHSGAVDPALFRAALLKVRTGQDGGGSSWVLERPPEQSLSLRSLAATYALRAAWAWSENRPDEALGFLRQANDDLRTLGSNRGWIPVYAEGRFCRTARDFVAALNERRRAGLTLPPAPERAEYEPGARGFVRHWLLLGPIPLGEKAGGHVEASQKVFFDREWFRGAPKEGDRAEVDGAEYEWQAEEPPGWGLDFGWAELTLTLGVTYLVCEKDLSDVVLSIGSDDSSSWRLDGKEILRVYAGRGLEMDQNRTDPFTLKAGVHTLALAVVNGTRANGACARFLDRGGNPVRDYRVLLTPGPR